MTVLFEGDVRVHYGFVHLDSGVGGSDQAVEQRAGQRNGLLGAAQPGFLLLSTGMHTGLVPFLVEVLPAAPPVDETWDEIVEASCDLRGPDLRMSTFEWGTSLRLPRGGPHRVRFSARDFAAGRAEERYAPDEPVRDRYLLQLWPAALAPDEVVKVTSDDAAYWHGVAAARPDAPMSPHEQALAEQRDRDDRQAYADQVRRNLELHSWGGRAPSSRLREVEEQAVALTREHRDLVDAVAALPEDRQRALAVQLAAIACAADDGPLDWRPALDALAAGRPLPPPFDDPRAVRDVLFPGPATTTAVLTTVVGPSPPRRPLHPGVAADAAVRGAAARDPLAAALRAIDAASWSAPDLDRYFADVAERVARD